MAKVKAKGKAAKVKKKAWFDIVASADFNNAAIGQSYVDEKEQLVGKTIKVNLNELTGDPKKQNILIQFKINELKGEKGIASVVGFKLNTSSIKRMMRRGKNRVDFSSVFKSKDGVEIRLKPFLVTRFASTKAMGTQLRKATEKFLQSFLDKNDYVVFVKELIAGKLQYELRDVLGKMVPMQHCQIREMKIEIVKKGMVSKATDEAKEEVKVEAKAA
tara:strand:- start:4073 stop:4723 length:651 start_codon:yes stop_codon:yes gene_type:complete